MKRSGPFNEPPDSEKQWKLKSCCPHPLPENQLLFPVEFLTWKRLKGKNAEVKHFRKLQRRKQSSMKISKISRNTLNSSVKVISSIFWEIFWNIFYELLVLLRSFQKFLPFAFLPSGSFWLTKAFIHWMPCPPSVKSASVSVHWFLLRRILFSKVAFKDERIIDSLTRHRFQSFPSIPRTTAR